MSYCTAADVMTSVGADVLADMLNIPTSELLGDASLAAAVLDASTRVDSYLSSRYALPLPVAAPSLRVVAVDIAIYYLFRMRRPGDLKDYLARYQLQVDWLEQVRTGKLDVPELSAVADANREAVVVVSSASSIGWGNY